MEHIRVALAMGNHVLLARHHPHTGHVSWRCFMAMSRYRRQNIQKQTVFGGHVPMIGYVSPLETMQMFPSNNPLTSWLTFKFVQSYVGT